MVAQDAHNTRLRGALGKGLLKGHLLDIFWNFRDVLKEATLQHFDISFLWLATEADLLHLALLQKVILLVQELKYIGPPSCCNYLRVDLKVEFVGEPEGSDRSFWLSRIINDWVDG